MKESPQCSYLQSSIELIKVLSKKQDVNRKPSTRQPDVFAFLGFILLHLFLEGSLRYE